MNRLMFIGQMNDELISVDDIIRYFDQSIAAYETVKSVDDAMVHGEVDRAHSSLKIKIVSPNSDDLQLAVNQINETLGNRKNIYGRSFRIDAAMIDSTAELFVREIKY